LVRSASEKYALATGLTLVVGRPFALEFQQQVMALQSALEDYFRGRNVPVIWYQPTWLHCSLVALTRTLPKPDNVFYRPPGQG